MTDAASIEALLAAIDAGASGLTICRIPAGVTLAGPPVAGVSMLQVLQGTMRLELPDGAARTARAGDLVLVPGGVRPQMTCEGDGRPRLVDGRTCLVRRDGWLIADAAGGRHPALVVAAARITGTTERSLAAPLTARLSDLPEGRQALTMLRAELARAAPGSNTLAVTLMSACLVIGLRIAVVRPTTRDATPVTVRRVSIDRALAAVRARPGDPHTIDTMASAAGMSRSTLTRHFRRVLNTTPSAFVQRARLTEAAALLRATTMPVKAVATTTGFVSRSHFWRVFQSNFGVDPSTYRTQPTNATSA